MDPQDISHARILVVDDSSMLRMLNSEMLSLAGYTAVETADDGQEALEKIQAAKNAGQSYALILSDNNMPRLNGIDLLQQLRAEGDITPFALISGDADAHFTRKVMALGADACLPKPFSPDVFEETVERLLCKPAATLPALQDVPPTTSFTELGALRLGHYISPEGPTYCAALPADDKPASLTTIASQLMTTCLLGNTAIANFGTQTGVTFRLEAGETPPAAFRQQVLKP